jgi:hypothetical protein
MILQPQHAFKVAGKTGFERMILQPQMLSRLQENWVLYQGTTLVVP